MSDAYIPECDFCQNDADYVVTEDGGINPVYLCEACYQVFQFGASGEYIIHKLGGESE